MGRFDRDTDDSAAAAAGTQPFGNVTSTQNSRTHTHSHTLPFFLPFFLNEVMQKNMRRPSCGFRFIDEHSDGSPLVLLLDDTD